VLIAITSNGKLGLGLVALLFILFAVVTAIVLPRSRPDFPGERLGAFVLGSLVLFVAMITAVVVFAKEGGEGEHAAGGESVPTETQPAETQPTETLPTETGAGGGATAGDPAKGEPVFASAGCNGCHTLSAANANGSIGPNLDDAKPSYDLVVERVTEGKGVMPSFKGQLSDEQIADVAAFVSESAKG
jgi:cytochrome c6